MLLWYTHAMITDETVNRINELARKSRETSLTPEEAAEQKELRAAYVAAFRRNLTSILENTVIQEPDGTRHKLKKD